MSQPALTEMVMRVITFGSLIEYRWSLILVDFLQADPETGMAMYHALSSTDARRAALNAAAKLRLPTDDYLLFQAVAKVTAPQRSIRNDFAHHMWGDSPELKDKLLLIDPKYYVEFHVGVMATNKQMREKRVILPPRELDISKIQVYSRKALENITRDAGQALELVSNLGIGTYVTDGATIHAQQRQQLLCQPLIAQALQRLSKQSIG